MTSDAEYQPPMFRVHVDAIVSRGDEILVMKRAMGALTGAWYFPGGSLEHGEAPEAGARREIREETQLEVDDLRLFRVWHYGAEEAHTIAISFTCTVSPGTEPRINEEHAAARWVKPQDYRERYFTNDIMHALQGHPALELVTGVRDLVDAYIAAQA
jgi:8-oxo-dGTP diphosphatase